jgi:hypothetical protein
MIGQRFLHGLAVHRMCTTPGCRMRGCDLWPGLSRCPACRRPLRTRIGRPEPEDRPPSLREIEQILQQRRAAARSRTYVADDTGDVDWLAGRVHTLNEVIGLLRGERTGVAGGNT